MKLGNNQDLIFGGPEKRARNDDFLGFPSPEDMPSEIVAGGAIEMQNMIVDPREPEMQRYLAQMLDPAGKFSGPGAADAAQMTLPRMTVTEALAWAGPIDSLSHYEALRAAKALRDSLRYSTGHSQSDVDECMRKSWRCLARAATLRPIDYVLKSILKGARDEGLLDRFPDEIARVYEAAIAIESDKDTCHRRYFFDEYCKLQKGRGKMDEVIAFARGHVECFLSMDLPASPYFSEMIVAPEWDFLMEGFPRALERRIKTEVTGDRWHDYGIFDAYYELQVKRGKLDEVVAFMRANLEIFTRMTLSLSSAFTDIVKHLPGGEQILMEIISKNYHDVFAKGGGKILVQKRSLAKTYIIQCCLHYRGDYGEAKRAAEAQREWLERDYPRDWEKITEALNGLIPGLGEVSPFTEKEEEIYRMQMRQGRGDPRMVAIKTREAAIMSPLLKNWEADLRSGGSPAACANCIEIFKEFYKNPAVLWDSYCMFLVRFLNMALPGKTVEAIDLLFAAEKEGTLRVPVNMKVILVARLAEAYFQEGKFKEVVDLYQEQCVTEKCPAARGTAYYLMKSCFEIAAESPEYLAVGISVISGQLAQFAGTQWEVEIWRGYLIHMYPEFENTIKGGVKPTCVLSAMERVIASPGEDPKIIAEAKIVRLRVAVDEKKSTGKLGQWAAEILPPAAQCEVDYPEAYVRQAAGDAIKAIFKTGDFGGAEKVLRLIPEFEKDPELVKSLCTALLHPSLLTRERFDEAVALTGRHPELAAEMKDKILRAREALKIVNYNEISCDRYMEGVRASNEKSNQLHLDDGIRISFLFAECNEAIRLYRKELAAYARKRDLGEALGGAERRTEMEPLADIFGIESITFAAAKNGGFNARCLIKTEKKNALEREFIEFSVDGNFNVHFPRLKFPPEKEASLKLFCRLLEACLLEESLETVIEVPFKLTEEALDPRGGSFEKFKGLVENQLEERRKLTLESGGMAGIERQNLAVLERMSQELDKMRRHPNFPAYEETIGLIARYLEVIRDCRDLDRPNFTLNCGIDPESPFHRITKYLKIFADSVAREELEKREVAGDCVSPRLLRKGQKNNFVGYYQLMCYFPDVGEVPVSVFLDERGHAEIPGITKDHPLYNQLWLLTLESLATKVVPEMASYSHVFCGRNPSDKPKDPFNFPDYDPTDEVSRRRRTCCSILMVQGQMGNERTPAKKLTVLDSVCRAFTTIELAEKDFSKWPLYYKDPAKTNDREYKGADGLIIRHEDKNFVDVEVLKELLELEEDDGFFLLEAVEIGERKAVPVEKLPPAITDKLIDGVRIRSHYGRAFRIPITFSEQPHEITNIGGEDYYLVPAKNRRGDTVTRGGKLFRLEKLPPHAKVKIGGKTCLAIPGRMSEGMTQIYSDTSTVEVDFSPKKSLYTVLYDADSGEILAYTFVSSADKGADSLYLHPKARQYSERHAQEGLSIMLDPGVEMDPRIKAMAASGKRFAEALFEVDSNIGFRQGIFPKLWRYLSAGRGPQDVAIKLLLEGLQQKAGSAEYQELQQELIKRRTEIEEVKAEEGDGEDGEPAEKLDEGTESAAVDEDSDSEPGTAKKRRRRRPHSSQKESRLMVGGIFPSFEFDPTKPFRIDPRKDSKKGYAGLYDRDLYLLSRENPLCQKHFMCISLEKGEVIALVGGPNGSPARVREDLLIKK